MTVSVIRPPDTPTGMVTVPRDPITLGNIVAASGFFQDSREGAQAAVKILAGQELGFGPVASMTGINIIKGRVTLSANLMGAAIKRHPRYTFRVREHSADACIIDFVEDGETVGTSPFTMEDARTAGLAGGENWKKYPRNMLYARALSNGAKWYCPDVFAGAPVYTPDELGATVNGETGEMLVAPRDDDVVIPAPTPRPSAAAPHPGDGAGEGTPAMPAAAPPSSEAPPPAPADDRPLRDDEVTTLTLRVADAPAPFVRMHLIRFGVVDVTDVDAALRGLTVTQAHALADAIDALGTSS